MGVLVMFILFNFAGVLLQAILPAIKAGLEMDHPQDGIQFLVFVGIIFAIEAAYQTAYQISQSYMGE
jgi:hypothetical protein